MGDITGSLGQRGLFRLECGGSGLLEKLPDPCVDLGLYSRGKIAKELLGDFLRLGTPIVTIGRVVYNYLLCLPVHAYCGGPKRVGKALVIAPLTVVVLPLELLDRIASIVANLIGLFFPTCAEYWNRIKENLNRNFEFLYAICDPLQELETSMWTFKKCLFYRLNLVSPVDFLLRTPPEDIKRVTCEPRAVVWSHQIYLTLQRAANKFVGQRKTDEALFRPKNTIPSVTSYVPVEQEERARQALLLSE